MSDRVTLDHYRRGNDFNVPADGTMDEAAERHCYQRPLKLFFIDRASLGDWFDACVRVFGYWDVNGPSGFFQRAPDGSGYVDVTPSHTLTPADYGRTDDDLRDVPR